MEKKTFEEVVEELRSADERFIECRAWCPRSGCTWEVNYFALKDGMVFPLFVSGRAVAGHRCLFDLEEPTVGVPLDTFVDYYQELPRYYDSWEHSSVDELDLEDFGDNLFNQVAVLLDHYGLQIPSYTCDQCGRSGRGIAHFLGARGNGGVGINLSDPCCPDCFSTLQYCDTCFGYVEPNERGDCPEQDGGDEEHKLYEMEDQAQLFGMDGSMLLPGSDGLGASFIVIQKI